MTKGGANGPGIYSATYSGIPVYEYQFGTDLKEHVMRRRSDDWINATHILKAAGFDKPARTRILERDVQKATHVKIQGGYGKYQGTWIPIESARALAERHSVYDRISKVFEFEPGNESPPPAPRHISKPKQPRAKPALPKWGHQAVSTHEDFDGGDIMMGEDDTPDNVTIASASYLGEDDRFDMSQMSTGHRKRKREEYAHAITEQQHAVYGDELLDYFTLSSKEQPAPKPEPPPNFQPNWAIDRESHTALHWASAMGDVDVIKQLKRFNASIGVRNIRGETPLMWAVKFTNCHEKQTFPAVMKELFETVDLRDLQGCTVIHHAAVMKDRKVFSPSSSRYYLENILNKLQETLEPSAFQELLDAQNNEGNTALHLAAQREASKCIRSLLGRSASTDIVNAEGIQAGDLISELNVSRANRGPQRSSSPFAPDSQRRTMRRDAMGSRPGRKPRAESYQSGAAARLQSSVVPTLLEKVFDLAKSYEEDWQEKNAAEVEARRLLANTQADLDAVHRQISELESQLEPDEVAAKQSNEANIAKHHVLSLIMHQSRLHVQKCVDADLSRINGDATKPDEASYEEKLALARQLNQVLADQRQAELEYVDALSTVGTGDNIEKYKKLLKRCLDAKEGESLDSNLDSLIVMMEEEKDVPELDGQQHPRDDVMELTA